MVVWLEIETWVISKVALKGEGHKEGYRVSWGRSIEAAGFWGPCVGLGVVPLL
jgi:hypothetical protein